MNQDQQQTKGQVIYTDGVSQTASLVIVIIAALIIGGLFLKLYLVASPSFFIVLLEFLIWPLLVLFYLIIKLVFPLVIYEEGLEMRRFNQYWHLLDFRLIFIPWLNIDNLYYIDDYLMSRLTPGAKCFLHVRLKDGREFSYSLKFGSFQPKRRKPFLDAISTVAGRHGVVLKKKSGF